MLQPFPPGWCDGWTPPRSPPNLKHGHGVQAEEDTSGFLSWAFEAVAEAEGGGGGGGGEGEGGGGGGGGADEKKKYKWDTAADRVGGAFRAPSFAGHNAIPHKPSLYAYYEVVISSSLGVFWCHIANLL